MFSEYSRMLSLEFSRRISSFIPMIALMGVRISWDIFARNVDLARFDSVASKVWACSLLKFMISCATAKISTA